MVDLSQNRPAVRGRTTIVEEIMFVLDSNNVCLLVLLAHRISLTLSKFARCLSVLITETFFDSGTLSSNIVIVVLN